MLSLSSSSKKQRDSRTLVSSLVSATSTPPKTLLTHPNPSSDLFLLLVRPIVGESADPRVPAVMDLPSLTVVLRAALSPNPDERKAAEESLNQVNSSATSSILLIPILVFESLVRFCSCRCWGFLPHIWFAALVESENAFATRVSHNKRAHSASRALS